MTKNTELWDKLGKTDPAHTKTFKRAGGFSGTAIKPMWSYRRMTEEFGPCGVGWGVSKPEFQVVPAGDEMLVFCTVSIWYSRMCDGGDNNKPYLRKTDEVFGVGGDKVLVKQQNGLRSDDEAFKKAYTDAVTNALKMIGVGADVHMGLFDDSKYVNTMVKEFSEPTKESEKKTPPRNEEASQLFTFLQKDFRTIKDTDQLKMWWKDMAEDRSRLPVSWQENLKQEWIAHGLSLKSAEETIAAETGGKIVNDRYISNLEAGE